MLEYYMNAIKLFKGYMDMDAITLIVAIIAATATVYAAIKTAHAAEAARKSADISADEFKTQIKEKEKIERPRLVPLSHYVAPHPTDIISDWKTSTEIDNTFTEFKTQFSNTKIPMINTGTSYALDIKYTFQIVGNLKNEIKEYNSEKVHLVIDDLNPRDNEMKFKVFDFQTQYRDSVYDEVHHKEFEVTSYGRYISLIQSNQTAELYIPSFFVVLCNLYSKEFPRINSNENEVMTRPRLRLIITYRDQYDNEVLDDYIMELSERQFIGNDYNFRLDTWIEFKHQGTTVNQEALIRDILKY